MYGLGTGGAGGVPANIAGTAGGSYGAGGGGGSGTLNGTTSGAGGASSNSTNANGIAPVWADVVNLMKAVERAETLRWMLIAAQARIDVFRTQEASNRFLERSTI